MLKYAPPFLFLAAGLAGCASIIDSYPVQPDELVIPRQGAGSYFLPKHILRLQATGTHRTPVFSVSVVAVQDGNAHLQTGFNLSAFSDDDVKIVYEAGLLKQVAATATDKSSDVIVQVAKTVTAFRNGPATSGTEEQISETFEFNAFDPDEAEQINSKIRRRFPNSCIEVEVEPGLWSPGCNAQSLGRQVRSRNYVKAYASDEAVERAKQTPGIYYRRPQAHRVHVVKKGITQEITSKSFANVAPVFRIDVDRTAFVKRQTTIDFLEGVPTSVAVVKDSEALAIANLPLKVVNAVISAPVDAITERKKLVEAESGLLTAEKANLEARTQLQTLAATQGSALPREALIGVNDRSAQTRRVNPEDCKLISDDPELCKRLLQ